MGSIRVKIREDYQTAMHSVVREGEGRFTWEAFEAKSETFLPVTVQMSRT